MKSRPQEIDAVERVVFALLADALGMITNREGAELGSGQAACCTRRACGFIGHRAAAWHEMRDHSHET